MKRITRILVALLALVAFASVAASSATAAEPTLLNAKGENAPTGTAVLGKSGEAVFTSGFGNVKCSASTVTGEVTTPTTSVHGKLHVMFTGCKSSLGGTCQSASMEAGNILILILFLLHYDSLTTLGVAVLFGLVSKAEGGDEPVKFECTGTLIGSFTIEVRGGALALFKTINSKTKSSELIMKASGAKQEEKKYWEGGTEKEIHLESNLNGGAFEESSQALTGATQELSGQESEVMG